MSRGMFKTIRDFSNIHPERIALHRGDGKIINYRDIVHVFDQVTEVFNRNAIQPCDRIGCYLKNSLINGLVVFPIIDNAVICVFDDNLKPEALLTQCAMYQIDYLLTDMDHPEIEDLAHSVGFGVFTVSLKNQTCGSMELDIVLSLPKTIQPNHPEDPTVILINQTSGTTNHPKLFPKTQSEMLARIRQHAEVYDYHEDTMLFIVVPLSRMVSLQHLMIILSLHGCLIFQDRLDFNEITDILMQQRVDIIRLTPATASALIDHLERKKQIVSLYGPTTIHVGGARLPKPLREKIAQVFQQEIIHSYGMSETGNIANIIGDLPPEKEDSVGTVRFHEIKIIDGELCVKGPIVFKGYENVSNDDVFVDGWFRTGDLGYMDEEGYLFITGRIKEMINRGGQKISPFELEDLIHKIDFVKEVYAFPYPGENGIEEVGIAIVPEAGHNFTLKELRSILKTQVKAFSLPTLLYVVDEIPKSHMHKVQRSKLFALLNPEKPT